MTLVTTTGQGRRPRHNEAAVAQSRQRQRRDPLHSTPGREGDTVQGQQLGVVITEKRNRCRELIVVDGFSDVQ